MHSSVHWHIHQHCPAELRSTYYTLHTRCTTHPVTIPQACSRLDSLTPTLLAMFGAALAGALGSGGDAANFFRGMSADRYTNLHTPPMHCTAPHRSAPHSTTSQHRSTDTAHGCNTARLHHNGLHKPLHSLCTPPHSALLRYTPPLCISLNQHAVPPLRNYALQVSLAMRVLFKLQNITIAEQPTSGAPAPNPALSTHALSHLTQNPSTHVPRQTAPKQAASDLAVA